MYALYKEPVPAATGDELSEIVCETLSTKFTPPPQPDAERLRILREHWPGVEDVAAASIDTWKPIGNIWARQLLSLAQQRRDAA